MDTGRRAVSAGLLSLGLAPFARARSAGDRDDSVVLPLATDAAAWDNLTVSCPRVLRLGPRDFRMWYYGRDADFDRDIRLPTGRIGLARSRDGIHWQRVLGPATRGAVMDPSADPARFDSGHVGVGDVQRDGTGFEMWYFGGDQQFTMLGDMRTRGFPLRIGRASSPDGLNWRRIEGPVRGAVLDVGAPGSPDAASVGWPQVLKLRENQWRMYYHTVNRELGFVICAAESADQGQTWTRLGVLLGRGAPGRFDVGGASTRQVFRQRHRGRERFVMLYEGWGEDRRPSLGLAESQDGLDWKRLDGPLPDGAILSPSPRESGRWDCGAIGTPWFVDMDRGRFHMYYVGREVPAAGKSENDARYQIGLAVSEDPALLRWRRWNEA